MRERKRARNSGTSGLLACGRHVLCCNTSFLRLCLVAARGVPSRLSSFSSWLTTLAQYLVEAGVMPAKTANRVGTCISREKNFFLRETRIEEA